MTKKKAAQEAPAHVLVHPEVWEQMWRVIDSARFISCPPRGTTEDDLRSHLADSEKMLRRSIAFFYGEEVVVRGAATKHPWTVEIEEKDRQILKAQLRGETPSELPFNDLCSFSELGMGPTAERK